MACTALHEPDEQSNGVELLDKVHIVVGRVSAEECIGVVKSKDENVVAVGKKDPLGVKLEDIPWVGETGRSSCSLRKEPPAVGLAFEQVEKILV